MVIQGYYSQKVETIPKKEVEVKYIPLSLYEEQMSPSEKLDSQFKSMFNDITPGLRSL